MDGNNANRVFNVGSGAVVRIEGLTITGGKPPDGEDGGGILNEGTANLSNTIVANSTSGGNCGGSNPITDGGYNIEDGTSCSFSQANNSMPSTEPLLKELGNNGGPTLTHALRPPSPAINAIPSATNGCATTIATNQRGVKRPQGGNCEIGSFEDRSPWVRRVVPLEDATGISPRTKVNAFFSEQMRPLSISTNTFKLFEKGSTVLIEAQVEYDALSKRAILTPREPLELGKSYRVRVNTGVKDLASNLLDQDPSNGNQPKIWFFTVRN